MSQRNRAAGWVSFRHKWKAICCILIHFGLWLLRSLLSTELYVLVIAQVPVINALVLSSLCEYRHISHILLKTIFFGLHFCCKHYSSIFNHFYAIVFKGTEFDEITQNRGYYTVQGRSRSPILEPVKSPNVTSY